MWPKIILFSKGSPVFTIDFVNIFQEYRILRDPWKTGLKHIIFLDWDLKVTNGCVLDKFRTYVYKDFGKSIDLFFVFFVRKDEIKYLTSLKIIISSQIATITV